MMSMPMRQGGDSRPTMTIKLARAASLTPLDVEMLSFSGNLQGFLVGTVYRPLKLLQGPALGAVAPPDGKPEVGYGGSRVHEAEDGYAFQSELACDGPGPTAHPTGVTLALGDPPNSLNAPGGSLGYLPGAGSSRICPLGGP